jgi:ribonuclease Z
VPGVVQRLSLDGVSRPVPAHFPGSGRHLFGRLRHACAFHDTATVVEEPVGGDGVVTRGPFGELSARRLDHPVETYGYRLVEPDGRRMLPDRLAAAGIAGHRGGRGSDPGTGAAAPPPLSGRHGIPFETELDQLSPCDVGRDPGRPAC